MKEKQVPQKPKIKLDESKIFGLKGKHTSMTVDPLN